MKEDWLTLQRSLAHALDVDPALLAGQVEQESSWNPDAVGSFREIGLGQIKLETAQDYHAEWSEMDLHDPIKNLVCQYEHLRNLKEWLARGFLCDDVRMMFAAYNWGAGNVRKHLAHGGTFETLPEVVQMYVNKIYERAERYR